MLVVESFTGMCDILGSSPRAMLWNIKIIKKSIMSYSYFIFIYIHMYIMYRCHVCRKANEIWTKSKQRMKVNFEQIISCTHTHVHLNRFPTERHARGSVHSLLHYLSMRLSSEVNVLKTLVCHLCKCSHEVNKIWGERQVSTQIYTGFRKKKRQDIGRDGE